MSDDYFGDAIYDVWRAGGNPDAVSRDEAWSAQQDGVSAEDFASSELRRQHRRDVERDMREWEANEWDLPADERFSG